MDDLDLKHDLALTFAERMTEASTIEELQAHYHDFVYEDIMNNWTLAELEEELRSMDPDNSN